MMWTSIAPRASEGSRTMSDMAIGESTTDDTKHERAWYWYEDDVHSSVGPVSWALLIDGRPIDGYSIVSPKGTKVDVYGRTDEVGVEILSEYCNTGEIVEYAINDSHNLSRNHKKADWEDVLRNGMDADFTPASKGKHDGTGELVNLETARASPNPNKARDRFGRAFAFRIYGKKRKVMTPGT